MRLVGVTFNIEMQSYLEAPATSEKQVRQSFPMDVILQQAQN